MVEAKAILQACIHFRNNNHNQVIIQTDSLLLLKILTGMWSIPWMVADIVQDIKECLDMRTHKFQCILRDGNQLAKTEPLIKEMSYSHTLEVWIVKLGG